jgi:hypothetical protein
VRKVDWLAAGVSLIQAAKDWPMIKEGGIEFATFSNQWEAKASYLDQ